MAESTNISEEYYDNVSIFITMKGELEIISRTLGPHQMLIAGENSSRGVKSTSDSVFLEINFKKGEKVMNHIDKGKIIELENYIDYVDGGISNLDLVSRDDLKIMLMAFDKGQGLTPHSAPGDALVLALEGRAELQVGDDYFEIRAGQQMIFPKEIVHNVRAKDKKFKMALILVIDQDKNE